MNERIFDTTIHVPRSTVNLFIYKICAGIGFLIYKILFGVLFQIKSFSGYSFNRWVSTCIIDPFKVLEISLNGVDMDINISSYSVRQILSQTINLDFEREAQDWLAENLQENDIFLNVGANIGYYVIYANKLVNLKRTISLEASSINVKEILQNIYLNGFEKRDMINFHCAVSDENKWGEFVSASVRTGYYDGRVCGKAPLLKQHENPQGKEIVAMRKIDTIIDEVCKGEFPNIVVMDIDGNEVLALKGMEKTLNFNSLRGVVIETRKNTFCEVNEILLSNGFKCINKTEKNTDKCWNMIFAK